MRFQALLPALLLTLAGAVQAQAGTPSEADLNAVKVARLVKQGAVVPGTPSALNASITVRYGSPQPRTIILLMPGFLGGAGSLDRLARQLVALNPAVGVWAVDRRSNLLEPQADLAYATPARLRQIVQQGLPPREPGSVSFMRDWGLNVTLEDWRVAVQEARRLTPHVFIGGHSLGAVLSTLYAASDFGGQPGFQDVRGLILLDGLPGMNDLNSISSRQVYEQGSRTLYGNQPGLRQLATNPYVNLDFYGPSLASRAAAQARLAALKPQETAPEGGLTPYPATNLAAGLLQLEQRYATLPFLSLRSGKPTNAREVRSLPAALLGWDSYRVIGPLDARQPVGWQSDPQASVDGQDFVNRYWNPVSDYTEWYFPYRLLLDISAAGVGTLGTPFEQDFRVWHTRQLSTPILGIAAQYGLTKEADYQRYASLTRGSLTTHTLAGAAHLDVTAARSDQVARWILAWLPAMTR